MSQPQAAKPESSSDELSLSFWAIAAVVGVALLNGLFYFSEPAAERAHTLPAFATFTVVVAAALVASTARPRDVGHGLAGLLGVAATVAGVSSLGGKIPFLLALVLLVIGASSLWLILRSMSARSRLAWAFLASLMGVLAVCTLFGAPKVRDLVGIPLWIAMIVPGLALTATISLAKLGGDYRETFTPLR